MILLRQRNSLTRQCWALAAFVSICDRAIAVPQEDVPSHAGTARRLAGDYTVEQGLYLEVLSDGAVKARMDITFVLTPAATLSYGFKSIMSKGSTGGSVEDVRVVSAEGQTLTHTMQDDGSHYKVEFRFSQPIAGSITPKQTVSIWYTIRNVVCTKGDHAFLGMPWMDQWQATVTQSKYRLEFRPPVSMTDACLHHATGSTCENNGNQGLARANREVTYAGMYSSPYFSWPSYYTSNSWQSCGSGDFNNFATEDAIKFKENEGTDDDEGDGMAGVIIGVIGALVAIGVCAFCVVAGSSRGGGSHSSSTDHHTSDTGGWWGASVRAGVSPVRPLFAPSPLGLSHPTAMRR